MKLLAVLAAIIIGGLLGLHAVLAKGRLLRYLDAHPHPTRVPRIQYMVGEGYYIFRNLDDAATYFLRLTEQYPTSPYADEAYFSYLRSLHDMQTPRLKMIELYGTYLERYPNGVYKNLVLKRIENLRNSPS